MALLEADRLLLSRIRQGEGEAWRECIARFEGRLLAFVESRLGDRATAEDVVQETFIGFLNALPNYDEQTPLESFLFAIAAHKLTDVLRKRGRRPTLQLDRPERSSDGAYDPHPADRQRGPSTLVRSQERRQQEARILSDALQSLLQEWQQRHEFERWKCIELIFVLGWSNKDVATQLGLSEQAVANHKYAVVTRLKELVRRAGLTPQQFQDLR